MWIIDGLEPNARLDIYDIYRDSAMARLYPLRHVNRPLFHLQQ